MSVRKPSLQVCGLQSGCTSTHTIVADFYTILGAKYGEFALVGVVLKPRNEQKSGEQRMSATERVRGVGVGLWGQLNASHGVRVVCGMEGRCYR